MLVLALESSTSSAKAMLFDTETGNAQTVSAPYSGCNLVISKGITNTEGVYQLMMQLGRSLANGKDIAAVSLCGTFHSMAILDQALVPSETYSWDYMAPAAMCAQDRQDEELVQTLYGRTGCMPHVTYMRHTLRYLRENGLRLTGKKLLSQGAYNFYRMTGQLCESISTTSGSGLLNIHSLQYDDIALQYAGIKIEQVGELVRYIQTAPLLEEAAIELGIKPGIPVVPAHPDGALNQIANGAAVVGQMTLSVGTSGAVRLTSDRPVIPASRALWCYYGVTDWLSGAAISGACNCIDWYKTTCMHDRFGYDELETAKNNNKLPVFLPFVFGERCPGWQDNRLGGFFELKPEHTAAELYQAVQMGILFNLFQCYKELCNNAGRPERIMVSGGILNSSKWTQMVADIFQHDIVLVKNANASTLGAAVLSAWAAGALPDVTKYTDEQTNGRVLSPRENLYSFYEEQYHRYLSWYETTLSKM